MRRPAEPVVTPIRWTNLARWARRTMADDRRAYRRRERPPSLRRVARSVVPALDDPVFLIGSGRSGTTFLGDCLGALPEISYHHEPAATKAAARYVYEAQWSFRRSRWFFRSVYGWLMRLHGDGDLRFCEKTPNNCLIVPFLARAFPGARFVYIVRDGRDAAVSHAKRPWFQAAAAGSDRREPGGYLYGPWARFWVEPERRAEFERTTDVHRCIWLWRIFNEHALAAFAALPAARCHRLRYEALVGDPGREAERLLAFLDIDAPDSRRRFLDAVGAARPDSVGTWRELTDDQLRSIAREAGPLLARLGYEGPGADADRRTA